MLIEGPVLFLGFASIALAMFALRVMETARHLRPEPVLRPRVLAMTRAEINRAGGLSAEASRDEASTEIKPLSWVHCALVILLVSALCYGLGYFAIEAL